MADAPESSTAAPMAAGFAPSSHKTASFLSLPIEIQKKIVAECSQSDLICLSLVSRHFRDLAAGQLYRNFHIVFPDEDDPAFDSPIDSLAGGLDTFVTAEYNYGQHLREISLDTLSAGPKSEKAYKPYLFGTSCGKFMNTLLLLTLKKSKSLEIFKWNIRVELSRSVYKALHEIHSLRKLQIRMQLGRSLYEALPPLPYTAPAALSSPSPPHSPHITSLPPIIVFNEAPTDINPGWAAAAPPAPAQGYPPPALLPPPPPPQPSHGNLKMPHAKWKSGSGKPPQSPPARDPPTLSGFRDLQSLSVLDIDSLDLVDELRACIKNSAPTLRKLRLSFSDSLAAQARKPPPDTESDDSDAEDEFQVVPAAQPASYDANGPAKTFRAQEERKKQEAVLTRVFNIDLFSAKRAGPAAAQTKPSVASSSSGPKPAGDDDKSKGKEKKEPAELDPEAEKQADINAGSLYEGAIRSVAAKLAERCNGTTGMSDEEAQEMLNIIVTASKIYVGSRSGGADKAKGQASSPDGPSRSARSDAGGSAVAEPSASPEPSAFSSGSKPNRPAGDKSEHADLGINMEVPDSDEDDGFETVDDDEEDEDEEGQGPVEVVNLDEAKSGDQGGGEKAAEGQEEEKKPPPAGEDADHVAQDTAGGAAAAAAESAHPSPSEPPPPPAPPTAAAARVEKVNLARLVARAQKIQGQADRLSGKIQKAIDSDQPLTEQEVRDAAREVHNLYASVAVLSDDIILAEAKCTKGKAAAAQAVPDRKGKAPATDPDTTADPADTAAPDITTTPSPPPTAAITGMTKTSPTAASTSTATATAAAAAKDEARAMREYVVSTHGIALQSLCIHLIPIRTSVLTRALDLHVLEKITLLNVGNQIPFWAQMFKENKLKALPLRRIFTDHVTPTFLQCVSQLDRVDELLLLERSAKYKPESFAPKVPTTIDQIRRLALNKHMPTLKRLMIKDASAQPSWDVNVKTMLMICLRGVKLEELAVSMNIAAVHTFMQHMKGLINLRALHIIHFRNSDTCVWVMRETLKFIVDNLAHHPNLKLEWIAIEDDRVDRIMRPTDSDDDPSDVDGCKNKKKDRKGKKKAAAAAAMSAAAAATAALGSSSFSGPAGGGGDMPELPADGWDYSDSGSDDDDYDPEAKLKLKTMTGVQFYDVWGVKLFSKEVRAGRL